MSTVPNSMSKKPEIRSCVWNLVVDVGSGTIDFLAAYDKVPNYGRSGAHPESMMACAYEVAKAINPELKNQYGVIQAIDLAIRDNRETVRIGGEDYEMARYRGAINEVLRRGYEAMLNTVGALNDFDNILVCGGGGAVFFEFLREHAPGLRRRLKMDGGSTFSNVRGFQVVADYAANEAYKNG